METVLSSDSMPPLFRLGPRRLLLLPPKKCRLSQALAVFFLSPCAFPFSPLPRSRSE